MPSRKRVVRQIYVHVGQGQKSWSGQENSNACGDQVRYVGASETLLDGKPKILKQIVEKPHNFEVEKQATLVTTARNTTQIYMQKQKVHSSDQRVLVFFLGEGVARM